MYYKPGVHHFLSSIPSLNILKFHSISGKTPALMETSNERPHFYNGQNIHPEFPLYSCKNGCRAGHD